MRTLGLVILSMMIALTVYAAKSGEDTFYSKCTRCHGSALSLNKNKSAKQWEETVRRMTKHGLSISSSEIKSVVGFLTGGK